MSPNEENNKSKKENNPFSMPDDYFNAFAKKMMLKIELADEIKEFDLLSSVNKKLPFVTPAAYFETKSELAEYPSLLTIKNKNAFTVPENYFERSGKTIQTILEVAEELCAYPELSSINKDIPFSVPVSYFMELPTNILADFSPELQQTRKRGKIIHIVFNKKTVYALAAMLVISLGLYFYNSHTDAASNACNTLACLDRNEIIKENQLTNFEEDALMEMVNTEELSKNLNQTIKKEHKNDNEQQNSEDYVLENVDVNEITDEI